MTELNFPTAAMLRSAKQRDAALAALVARVAPLRREAYEAGLEPYSLLVPFKVSASALIGTGSAICGMLCELHDGPLTVLAKPAKIGRYQVVFPTRFEENAHPLASETEAGHIP